MDKLPTLDALGLFLDGHAAAMQAVQAALPQIAAGAAMIAATLSGRGVLAYAGAGSSALMAIADAMELAGTFGVDPDRVRIHMAGGLPGNQPPGMPGATEDDTAEAHQAALGLGNGDLAIVVSASGTTPYALAFRNAAIAQGARVICLANTADAELFQGAAVAIALETGAEVIAGSTRLAAATAQKVTLNLMSSQAGVMMGHVHDGLMVNLRPDNIKLRDRAARIVASIAGCNAQTATAALARTDYDVKTAVLVAMGANLSDAQSTIATHMGKLRPAIVAIADRKVA